MPGTGRAPAASRPGTGASAFARAEGAVAQGARPGHVSFGAVYEHRDQTGKPRLVASTDVLPERQFQLDWQESAAVRDLCKTHSGAPGSSGRLVWVGIGSGPVGQEEMAQVRQAVVEARAERLRIDKLGSAKPYSRHF